MAIISKEVMHSLAYYVSRRTVSACCAQAFCQQDNQRIQPQPARRRVGHCFGRPLTPGLHTQTCSRFFKSLFHLLAHNEPFQDLQGCCLQLVAELGDHTCRSCGSGASALAPLAYQCDPNTGRAGNVDRALALPIPTSYCHSLPLRRLGGDQRTQ
jgi:hypothetical protein